MFSFSTSFLVFLASALLTETVEHEPVFEEAVPKFVQANPVVTSYQLAYNTVAAGGTATVTINGVPYFCWNENGTPKMQPVQSTCVNGQCGTSRTGWIRR